MQINCISCGHRFDLGRAYDDYEGLVKCGTCRSLLEIRTQDGSIRSVRPYAAATIGAVQSPGAASSRSGIEGSSPIALNTDSETRQAA